MSVKEALFMKQQGESTSTVERIRSLQDEIQGLRYLKSSNSHKHCVLIDWFSLRSQNDQLRAEIEAQSAAHKAQINAAESRAHDSWLAAKQAERRLEEAKSEAGVLRKKLTSLSFNPAAAENHLQIRKKFPFHNIFTEILQSIHWLNRTTFDGWIDRRSLANSHGITGLSADELAITTIDEPSFASVYSTTAISTNSNRWDASSTAR